MKQIIKIIVLIIVVLFVLNYFGYLDKFKTVGQNSANGVETVGNQTESLTEKFFGLFEVKEREMIHR